MAKDLIVITVALAVGGVLWATAKPTDHFSLGRAMLKDGLHERAIHQFDHAIEGQPEHADAYFYRGLAYLYVGEREKAMSDFTKSIELNPRNFSAYNNRSVLRKAKGDLEGSIADSTEAIALHPHDTAMWNNRAETCFRTGDIDMALNDLHASLQLNPKNPYTHHYLAWFYATYPGDSRRDGAKALEHAARACELSNWTLGFVISTLAAAHAEMGNFDEAVKYEEQARKLYTEPEMARWGERLEQFRSGEPLRDRSIRLPAEEVLEAAAS